MSNIVFVYGTLKQGYGNHGLLHSQEFLREARTLPKYRLYDVGHFPCMVKDDVNGVAVQGELYSVSDAIKRRLDYLEGVAFGLYKRELVEIDGMNEDVEAYFWGKSPSGLRDIGDVWPCER
jgi:gamma-glutamylcyclotransferase (GGCT)/AIG2-like uncharacterized protein YtfP